MIDNDNANVAVDGAEALTPAEAPEVTTEVQQPEAEKAPEEQPWPKKAVNAMSRKDKQLGKLRGQNQMYAQQLQAMEAELAKYKNAAPREEDFKDKTYGEFLEAQARYKVKQEQEAENKQRQSQQQTQQQQQFYAQREAHVAQQAQQFIAEFADAKQVLIENSDVIDDLPDHIQNAFLESDNAPLAFYTLAKEGNLERLAELSPLQAAIEIGKAIQRGSKPKPPVTQAPKPLAAAKGTGNATKSLAEMSPKELMKWAQT